jgi:hypothetical protein
MSTPRDGKPVLAETLGIPAHRTGHFSRLRGSNAACGLDVLLVVGTPTLRPEDVTRLAHASYHVDPQLLDETSVRGADGRWRYRDPRMQRVANALTGAELTRVGASQPAAALRWAGRRDAVRG